MRNKKIRWQEFQKPDRMGGGWTGGDGAGPDWMGGDPDRMGGGAGPERHTRSRGFPSRIMDLVLARIGVPEEIRT